MFIVVGVWDSIGYFFLLARSSGLYVSKSESESRRAKDS